MNLNKTTKFLVSIIICELAGVMGAVFTTPEITSWYSTLNKSSFNPPSWVFGPVWTILFILMGISLYLVWAKNWEVKVSARDRKIKAWNIFSQKLWTGDWRRINVILIFCAQLALNIIWSIIFFGMHAVDIAFFEALMLWLAILYTIINFYRISKNASLLLIPYLLWVSLAIVLNYYV
ncbi:MAG: tryptophan-rich sensory protein, partial [Atribacterota bacterium]|nr:tryptophan-rich sensory protein [Atribacterota bacterium]